MIKISSYLYNKIEKFAIDRVSGSANLYSYRGEASKLKMAEDIIIGTLGEYAVHQQLKSLGLECSKPDLKIYENRRKSYKSDLICEQNDIHVKSQSTKSAKIYGNSWLFQRTDSLVKEPHITDWLAFTCVDLDKREVAVLGYVWAPDMTGHWGECRVPRYRHSKCALYLDRIEELVKSELISEK